MTENIVTAAAFELDRPVTMHALVFHADGDEVTVGRRDTDSYGVFPADGAELVRRLADGTTPREAAAWYHTTYGEQVDVLDFLLALDELGFVRTSGEPADRTAPVRGQRLGRALFSWPAMLAYGGLVTWALVAMVRSPDLVPDVLHLFFTDSIMIAVFVLIVGQVPGLVLHEGFHALAGRRLGIRSKVTISRRLYYVVVETALDGLVSVPRRKRYLPILVGVLADVIWLSALTLGAEYTRADDGALTLAGRVCLSLGVATVLRIIWQFFFYLRTDLYALVCVLFGCQDLHTAAKQTLHNRFDRLRGRKPRYDEVAWHPVDRKVGRWYSWLIPLGYAFSVLLLLEGLLPALVHVFDKAIDRFDADSGASTAQIADSVVFIIVATIQFSIVALIIIREHRNRAKIQPHQHVLG